jgi:capsular polysaccharide transport system ATP-binding protein
MIELINVSKYYPTDFGRHYVFSNVSLKLPLDKSVGVIGPNGAGKSTFLRLIGGADIPSEGRILRTGRISPPMGLTPGLQPSLNGVENARFAGRIYGMDRDEIADLIEYVRETADIGKFFDMPVGTYSAGMKQRVAFAINMSMTFDYYLFDEIGAGGDREFRRTGKAMIAERLKTSKFIIASHRTDELLELCESGIVIKDGELTFYDDIDDALSAYNTDDDEDEERNAKRAARRARRDEAYGVVPANSTDTEVGKKSKRKSKRKARKAKNNQTDATTGSASLSEPAVPQEPASPPAIEDSTATPVQQETAAAPRGRDGRRTVRRARKRKTDITAGTVRTDGMDTRAASAEAAGLSPPKARGEEAIGADLPEISGPLPLGPAATRSSADAADQSRVARRQARRARNLAATAAATTDAQTAPSEVGVAETSGESRAELKARRSMRRETRLRARAANTRNEAASEDGSVSPAQAAHIPAAARQRGDEAIDSLAFRQSSTNPDSGRPQTDANSHGETRVGSGVR